MLAVAAGAGAAGLALSSTGAMVVAAVLLGLATRDRFAGLAAVLAVASVAVRFATAGFGDVAGIQSVLGPAGVVGPPAGAASAWFAAAAVVLAVRSPCPGDVAGGGVPAPLLRAVPAIAGGALAAAIVVGPGPGGALIARVVGTVVAIGTAYALTELDRRQPRSSALRRGLAVTTSVLAVVLAAAAG